VSWVELVAKNEGIGQIRVGATQQRIIPGPGTQRELVTRSAVFRKIGIIFPGGRIWSEMHRGMMVK
jgi:hypothetical protein